MDHKSIGSAACSVIIRRKRRQIGRDIECHCLSKRRDVAIDKSSPYALRNQLRPSNVCLAYTCKTHPQSSASIIRYRKKPW
ncbi:unnamed protein product [Caretta caretta]